MCRLLLLLESIFGYAGKDKRKRPFTVLCSMVFMGNTIIRLLTGDRGTQDRGAGDKQKHAFPPTGIKEGEIEKDKRKAPPREPKGYLSS